ncbi:MAG: hypothetical protein ACRESJ_26980 [Pseudomonas sp.]|uniref:hypothetical protein n=1 Tax=Pseudomonas sp. TaxID=306 RepID=UPI003D6DB13E
MKRRTFLKTSFAGFAVPTLCGSSGLSLAQSLSEWVGERPAAVISDARFLNCQRFGTAASEEGIRHFSVDGDITEIWFKHLDPMWRKSQPVVIGMTAHQPLFVLERLGWDRDMRVVLRVEHEWLPDGTVHHRLEAPAHQLPHIEALLTDASDWSERLARLGANCNWSHQGMCTAGLASAPATNLLTAPAPLVTWVMAPARTA